MKAVVNQEICIGCTLCVQACPGVFRMEGDKAVVYVEPVPEVSSDLCRNAASQCPVTAITIIE